jgi:hypothetical protein
MDQDTTNLIIARLNSVAVSVEDLVLASHVVHNLPPEQRDWEGQTTCITRLFNGQRYKAFAVHYRLQAMAALITSGKLPLPPVAEMSDGGRMVAEPIFVAAAKEPILFTGKEPFFNAESFIEAVLRHGGVDGHT